MGKFHKIRFISCGILRKEIDEMVERTGLPIIDRMEIGLDGLKNALMEALDRNRQKQIANKKQVE